MFDRFSDHARKCMGLARQESARLSHDHIGPEHILLGLMREESGAAHIVLRSLDVSPARIVASLTAQLSEGERLPVYAQLPFTPEAKRVLMCALEEASALGDQGIGTVHLLLGLLRIEDGVVRHVLAEHGPTLEAAREEVARMEPVGSAAAEESHAMPSSVDEVAEALGQVEDHVAYVLSEVRRLQAALRTLGPSRGD